MNNIDSSIHGIFFGFPFLSHNAKNGLVLSKNLNPMAPT